MRENNEALRTEMRAEMRAKQCRSETGDRDRGCSSLAESLIHDYIKPIYDKIMDIDRRLPDMEKGWITIIVSGRWNRLKGYES